MFAVEGEFFYIQDALDRERQQGGGSRTVSRASQRRQSETQDVFATLSRVGWKQSHIANRIGNLTDKYLDAYQDEEIINGFGNVWYSEVGWRDSVKDTLIAMGLKATVAAEVDRVCKPLLDLPSYTYDQVIEIALEYMADKYKHIRPNLSDHHYYNHELIGEWYSVPRLQCQCMNIPFVPNPSIESTLMTRLLPIHGHAYFFHTTNWDSVISIMKYGIDHGRGRRCLDFGTTPGFYMSDRLGAALDWGNKKYGVFENEVATLIFSIPINIRPLHLMDDEWTYVTRLSRRCRTNETKDDDIIQTVNKTDLVYGDMVGNPKRVKYKGDIPRAISNVKQLVSKTDMADKLIQKYLVGCFFYSAGGPGTITV